MATAQPKAGLVETTITTGTGDYQLQAALPPWRGFIAADDAKIYSYGVYQDGVGFEEGEGTYTHGTRTLSRTTITGNHLGTTSPVDWGSGTKEVSNILSAARTMLTSVENKIRADQFLRGNKQYLDSADTTWLAAVSNVVRFFVASAEAVKMEANKLTATWSNDTTTEGPELELDRISASPAVNDALGVIRISGRDNNQNKISMFKMRSTIMSSTPGAHASKTSFDVAKAGGLQPIMELRADAVVLQSGISLYSGGAKSSTNLATVGAEITNSGEVVAIVQDAQAGYFYRNGTDGLAISIGKNGSEQGGVNVAGGTVSIAGACLSHPTEWAPGVVGDAFESLGWVVCTADGILDDTSERHPLVRPSQVAGDPCVYGVVSGRFDGKLSIEAVGSGLIRCVGPVARGDLLETSDTEGCARRQVESNINSGTVAKATQSSPDEGIDRLVPCTLLGG